MRAKFFLYQLSPSLSALRYACWLGPGAPASSSSLSARPTGRSAFPGGLGRGLRVSPKGSEASRRGRLLTTRAGCPCHPLTRARCPCHSIQPLKRATRSGYFTAGRYFCPQCEAGHPAFRVRQQLTPVRTRAPYEGRQPRQALYPRSPPAGEFQAGTAPAARPPLP